MTLPTHAIGFEDEHGKTKTEATSFYDGNRNEIVEAEVEDVHVPNPCIQYCIKAKIMKRERRR